MNRPVPASSPRRRTRVAGIVAAALVISWGGPAAGAYWQTLGTNPGAARADSIPAVPAPTATVSGGTASLTWTSGTTAAGRPVSGYTVARYSSAIGGTKVAAGGACAGNITALTCSESALPAGTWYYTVTPVLASWTGAESARSGGIAGDSEAPGMPTITAPAVVNVANAASVPVSGTAEAGSSVTVAVRDSGAAHTLSQTVTANSSGQWAAANFDLTLFNDPTITFTAVAADAAGNASALRTVTASKDTAAPTAKVTLVNQGVAGTAEKGDTVTIRYSEPMDLPSICSTWVNGQQPAEISGNGDVLVTISSTNQLTVGYTGTGCTPKIGAVSLGANYVTPGSLTFGGSGSNVSKISWSNTTQTLTITLGGRSGAAKTSVGESSPTVVPPAGIKDLAGNQAVSAAPDATSRF